MHKKYIALAFAYLCATSSLADWNVTARDHLRAYMYDNVVIAAPAVFEFDVQTVYAPNTLKLPDGRLVYKSTAHVQISCVERKTRVLSDDTIGMDGKPLRDKANQFVSEFYTPTPGSVSWLAMNDLCGVEYIENDRT
jgi:hypothetical protein